MLVELRALSPAALQEMLTWSTASESHNVYNNALLRRWGHRLQVVRPVMMDGEETTTQDALAHLSLELPQHDHGALFYAHSFLADHGDGLPGQDAKSHRSLWIFCFGPRP